MGDTVNLTKREQEVAALLPSGLSDKEIGAELGLTRRGVAFHVMKIRIKLGARNRTHSAVLLDRVARLEVLP